MTEKNNNKSKKKIIVFGIVVIVLVIVVCAILSVIKHNTIKKEYAIVIDEKIEEYMSGSNPYGVSNIEYEITDIFKYDGTETMNVTFYLTTADKEIDNIEQSLLAYEVEDEVIMIKKPTIKSTDTSFMLGRYKCDYVNMKYTGKYGDFYAQNLITVYVNGEKILYPEVIEVDSSTVRCKSCGTKYKKESSNAESISKTGMCSSCYEGFKGMSNAIEEQPVN